MQRFWLDANVLIEAHRKYYSFDLAPAFWAVIKEQGQKDVIKIPSEVFRELTEGQDELAEWAKEHRDGGLFVEPDDQVQEEFREIASFVAGTYVEAEANEFLDGADPWVIAHAKRDMATVVTVETLVGPNSLRVKIPNICREFNVEYIDTFKMLRELEVSFVLSVPKQKGRAL
ncbi:MAG TPA: DUF4411 family protein [Terriglobia bacterium]|nr:DUF4411 family protein [Terriglobia bacterium]